MSLVGSCGHDSICGWIQADVSVIEVPRSELIVERITCPQLIKYSSLCLFYIVSN